MSVVRSDRRQGGFTLLEALVAVLIVGTGLLGASGLQLLSLRSTNQGLLRSQATALANDMAERIRANERAVLDGAFSALSTTAACASAPTPDCTAAACSTDELAVRDFYDSGCLGAVRLLPGGRMAADCDLSGAQPLCAVAVGWNEQGPSDDGPPADQEVALRFQP